MNKLKKIKFVCFFIVLFFIFTLVLSSCTSQAEEEWNKIKDSGAIEDFLDFAAGLDIANGKLFDEVNQKIKDRINEEENPEKLNALINQYPERKNEFKDRILEIELYAAIKENTPEALEEYMERLSIYSTSLEHDYYMKAYEILKNLYFNEAKEQKSIELLGKFIRRYENEDREIAEAAASLIDDIRWENAQKNGTRENYENIIDANTNYGFPSKYIEEAYKKIEELDWIALLEINKTEGTILPLKVFTEYYPNSVHVKEADDLIKQMQNDSSYSEKYLTEPDLDLIEEFILNFPGHKDMEKAMEIRKDFVGDIYSMIQKEYIKVVAVGDSITRSNIIIANLTKSRLEVTIPFGTYLEAVNPVIPPEGKTRKNVQNMLVREEKTFTVGPEKNGNLYINTACMNIDRDIPDDTSYFMVDGLQEDSLLIKLLKILDENESSYEVAQAAIWYVTDNPGKEVILDTLIYEDGTKAITENDYNEAIRLVELAGK